MAEALAGNADRLHEMLKREKSYLGAAYREISNAYDGIEAELCNDAILGSMERAMASLRQLVIESERKH